MARPIAIPVVAAQPIESAGDCGDEPFALQVLGESMQPEFADGDVVIVEPGGLARDGSFVVALCDGEWLLRQLVGAPGRWMVRALDPGSTPQALIGLEAVRGVVIQKRSGPRRRVLKRYA